MDIDVVSHLLNLSLPFLVKMRNQLENQRNMKKKKKTKEPKLHAEWDVNRCASSHTAEMENVHKRSSTLRQPHILPPTAVPKAGGEMELTRVDRMISFLRQIEDGLLLL